MYKPSKIVLCKNPLRLEDADFENAVLPDKKTYLKQLKKWQEKLLHIQQAYYNQGLRALIVFEGWDASGKGGAIRRITEKLDPRGFSVVPVAAPKPEEQGRHYLYRFVKELPEPGTMTIFDRSYYGRVLVERVESFATDREWQRAYQEINEFERMLIDDGVRIIKLFLHITGDEQLKRFDERLHNPYKRWKITEEDLRNRLKWREYEVATNDMLKRTSATHAPWTVIAANKKWYTRIEVLRTVCAALEEDVDISPKRLHKSLIEVAEHTLGIKVKVK